MLTALHGLACSTPRVSVARPLCRMRASRAVAALHGLVSHKLPSVKSLLAPVHNLDHDQGVCSDWAPCSTVSSLGCRARACLVCACLGVFSSRGLKCVP